MNNSVIVTSVIVGGTSALRVAYDPKVTDKPAAMVKIAVGVFALGAVLTLIGDAAPGVATILGIMLVIAALMFNAQAVATATGHALRK